MCSVCSYDRRGSNSSGTTARRADVSVSGASLSEDDGLKPGGRYARGDNAEPVGFVTRWPMVFATDAICWHVSALARDKCCAESSGIDVASFVYPSLVSYVCRYYRLLDSPLIHFGFLYRASPFIRNRSSKPPKPARRNGAYSVG